MSRITIRVIPNASQNEIVGCIDDVWKIRLAAPPIDGKANGALIRFLADTLDLATSEINIVKGQTSKTKVVDVPMHEDDVRTELEK